MVRRTKWILALVALTGSVAAHEYWLEPETFFLADGENARVSMRVGMAFAGEDRPFKRERTLRFQHDAPEGPRDLLGSIEEGASPAAVLPLGPGTHAFTFVSTPAFIELGPAEFAAYLEEEGLDEVRAARAASGLAEKPARELYSRHARTLVQVGDLVTPLKPAGLALEIVPLENPYALSVGDPLPLRVLLAGEPLSGAKLRVWRRAGGEVASREQRTEEGRVRLLLDGPGEWLLAVVHMAEAKDKEQADYESAWASLTFAVRQR